MNDHAASERGSVVTIGTFDGVHLGHQRLIRLVIERAEALNCRSVVVTFEPLPVSVLRPDRYQGRICTMEEKLERLRDLGIDHLDITPFTPELAAQAPETFLGMVHRRHAMRELWAGSDFALGRNRSGNLGVITTIGARLGFSTRVVDRIPFDGLDVSSTAIRAAIGSGDVAQAAAMLGRPFAVEGVVIHGAHLGRKIGYPTANIEPPADVISVADGIYASWTDVPGVCVMHPGMTYVGTRPTVDGSTRLIETHLFDVDLDLYGRTIRVHLVDRIRGDAVFDSIEELIDQLRRDEHASRAALAQHHPAEVPTGD